MVFRHLYKQDFVLRYPCCETFIDQGFCIACIGKGENVLDDHGDGKLFPYLLYVGNYVYHNFLREMPVCHINVAEAKRIMNYIMDTFEPIIEVCDTDGKCHQLRHCRGELPCPFYTILFHYVSSSVSSCALQVPLPNFNLAEQYLWAIQNRALEILDLCQALSSHTRSGYKQKRKKGVEGWDKQVCKIFGLADAIEGDVTAVLNYICLVDMDRLQCLENALK